MELCDEFLIGTTILGQNGFGCNEDLGKMRFYSSLTRSPTVEYYDQMQSNVKPWKSRFFHWGFMMHSAYSQRSRRKNGHNEYIKKKNDSNTQCCNSNVLGLFRAEGLLAAMTKQVPICRRYWLNAEHRHIKKFLCIFVCLCLIHTQSHVQSVYFMTIYKYFPNTHTHTHIYIYIYIYIYICHPQKDCFVILQLFSATRSLKAKIETRLTLSQSNSSPRRLCHSQRMWGNFFTYIFFIYVIDNMGCATFEKSNCISA